MKETLTGLGKFNDISLSSRIRGLLREQALYYFYKEDDAYLMNMETGQLSRSTKQCKIIDQS